VFHPPFFGLVSVTWLSIRLAEAFGLDGRLARLSSRTPDTGEGNGAPLALGLRFGAVHRDIEQPCLERCTCLEAVDPSQDAKPGVLRHLLGYGAIPYVQHRQTDHPRVITVE
jgi:hypothetical protein